MDNVLKRLKKSLNEVSDFVKETLENESPVIIQPYRGYANESKLWLKGRVLEDENIFQGKSESQIRNLIDNFKRFETDELAHGQVNIDIQGKKHITTTNEEGFFTVDAPFKVERQENPQWLRKTIELVNSDDVLVRSEAEVLVPSKNARFGVISDIDDTVLQTHVTSLFRLKMLYATFLKDSHQRLPMEGVVELFKTLTKGKSQNENNPVFYISHSPWNIYDLLEEFMQLQQLPKGPILLRDYNILPDDAFQNHKVRSIRHILKTYPRLPFVFLGDTASSDADFYLQIAQESPEQIKAIYIRQTKVTKNAKRVAQLLQEQKDIHAVLVHTSQEIEEHAAKIGLI